MDFIVPVILCGGSGSRLWPVTKGRPKHFVKLIGDLTLLQETALRVMNIAKPTHIMIVTLESMREEAEAQLNTLNLPVQFHFVTEPSARNTAAAVAMAALYAQRHLDENQKLWFTPADHYIGDEGALSHALSEAIKITDENYLAIFGIQPSRPETGYGYIHPGAALNDHAYKVATFVEKPDIETVQSYIANGFLWNSGMVLSRIDALLDQFKLYAPGLLNALIASGANAYFDIAAIPFDKAILEKSDKVAVIPCDPDWSDIGTMEGVQLVLDTLRQAELKKHGIHQFLSGVSDVQG